LKAAVHRRQGLINMHNGRVDIEFDPAKAAVNLNYHKVSFAHAAQALRGAVAVTIEP
jgi:hypothetical protein